MVRVVLHQGPTKAEHSGGATAFAGDPRGILTWRCDIRASLPVRAVADLAARHEEIADDIREWLAFAP